MIQECMLAHVLDFDKLAYPCWALPKLDGIRARYFKGKFYSRDNKVWNDAVVQHIYKGTSETTLPGKPDFALPLDGEFYCHTKKLQEINSAIAVKRIKPTEETKQIGYYVFDVVQPYIDFQKRYVNRLYTIQWMGFHVVYPTQIKNQEQLVSYHQEQKILGYEGTMVHNQDIGYESTRSWRLLKLKDFLDGEYMVFDKYEGEGKHAGRLGGLVCRTPSGATFNVGGGFTDFQREKYWQQNVTGKVIRISYQCLTNDGIPRHPNFLMEF